MTRCINQIERIRVACKNVVHLDGMALNRDTPLSL